MIDSAFQVDSLVEGNPEELFSEILIQCLIPFVLLEDNVVVAERYEYFARQSSLRVFREILKVMQNQSINLQPYFTESS